jgi:hypothetical protein
MIGSMTNRPRPAQSGPLPELDQYEIHAPALPEIHVDEHGKWLVRQATLKRAWRAT